MSKKTKTVEELLAEKEAIKVARKDALKKRMDMVSKADAKTLTTEAKSVLELIQENVSEAVSEAFDEIDLTDTVERLEEITDALAEVDKVLEDADLKNYKANIDEKLLKVRGMIEKANGKASVEAVKGIKEYIADKADEMKKAYGAQNGSVTISIPMNKKDAPDFISTIGSINPQPNPYMPAPAIQEGVVAIVHPKSKILDYVRTQSIGNTSLVVTNEVPGIGDFEWTEEGALKPYVDVEFKTETVSARKIAAFTKFSKEALTDIPFMQSETERIISDKYERTLSKEVFGGDGVGDSIYGVSTFAPAYTQVCLNGKIDSPGLSEVLFAAATQVRTLGFEGNLVAFVNPCDWAAEMMRKNTLGELLEMNRLLEGINVVPTAEVTPDKFLIGDLSVYTLYVYENFNISYGYENDDFRRNLVSMVAESRVFGFLPDNHKGALVADSVASVKSLIAE